MGLVSPALLKMIAGRLTYCYNDVSSAMQKIADKSQKFIVYAHNDGNRPHIHFLIEGITQSTDSIKNWIKKDVNGNVSKTDWSFKTEYDGSPVNYGYITYMSKGNLEPVHTKGFTDEEVLELRKLWIPRKRQEARQTHLKTKEKTYKDIVELAVERLDGSSSNERIVKVLNQILIDENKFIGRYKFRDLVDSIQARTDPINWIGQMVNFCQFR